MVLIIDFSLASIIQLQFVLGIEPTPKDQMRRTCVSVSKTVKEILTKVHQDSSLCGLD